MGRSLQNALINLGIEDKYKEALLDLGYAMEDIYDEVGDEYRIMFLQMMDGSTIGKGCRLGKWRVRSVGSMLLGFSRNR